MSRHRYGERDHIWCQSTSHRQLERIAEPACGDTLRNTRQDLKQIELSELSRATWTLWQATEPVPGALQ